MRGDGDGVSELAGARVLCVVVVAVVVVVVMAAGEGVRDGRVAAR